MASNTISILISAQDQASGTLRTLSKSLDDTSKHTDGFGASLARIRDVALGVYLPQLGAKLLELAGNALTSAGDFEQSRVAFEVMLGSAAKAQVMLTDLSQFAKETPFDLPGVVAASKQLLAYGFTQEQIIPTMRKLGDVAAGVSIPVGQIANVYGQVRVAGKLMGQDLLQFTQAGIPLLDYLATTMHKTTAQIKNDMAAGMGPTFAQVETAMNAMTDSGSKFGGMMNKQSHTFQGVMSNISDSFGQVGRAALGMDTAGNIVKGSFFDRIKGAAEAMMPALQNFAGNVGPMVAKAMDAMQKAIDNVWPGVLAIAKSVGDYLLPKFAALWDTIQNKLLPTFGRLWHEIVEPLLPVLGVLLVGAIGLASDALNVLFSVVTPVVNFLLTNRDFLLPIIGAFVGLKVAMMLGSAFDAITVGFATLQLITIPSAMASLDAMKVAIATPMVMPAIAATAALAAIAAVWDAYNQMKSAIDGLKATRDQFVSDAKKVDPAMWAIVNDGVSSPQRKAAARAALNASLPIGAFASGTDYAPGGIAMVGENGPELVNLPRGSQVIPASQTRQMMSDGAGSGGNVSIGQYNVYNQADPDRILRDISWKLATR